jgi:uncharacterized membrane protein
MIHIDFNTVWIDGKENRAAATLKATADLKRGASAHGIPVHYGSECSLLIAGEFTVELFQKMAELQRVDIAALRGTMVTVAENLLIVEQQQDEGALYRFQMGYGNPLRIMPEAEWRKGLED